MGMAAGQARLLSITSRISDNELSAQLLNNAKIRLATESSSVSEAYVDALNQTQMMFTNYNADDSTSYTELTFNSMTNYSQYNNQYGLMNSSGQILVSETDAANYQNSNGDLTTFLGMYGLSQDTTYFDTIDEKYTDASTGFVNYYDSDGNVAGDLGYSAEELKAMYLGGTYDDGSADGITYSGYDAMLTSDSYYQYTKYTSEIAETYETMITQASSGVNDVFYNTAYSELAISGSSKTLTDFQTATTDATSNNAVYTAQFIDYLDTIAASYLVSGTDNDSYESIKTNLNDFLDKYGMSTNNTTYTSPMSGITDAFTFNKGGNDNTLLIDFGDSVVTVVKNTDADGNITYKSSVYTDESEGTAEQPATSSVTNSEITLSIANYCTTAFDLSDIFDSTEFNALSINSDDELFFESEYTCYTSYIEEELQAELSTAYTDWLNSYSWNIDPMKFYSAGDELYDTYVGLCETFSEILFGDENAVDSTDYSLLQSSTGISMLIDQYDNDSDTTNDLSDKISDEFQEVLNIFTLDIMMSYFGEPNVAWIDSTDSTNSGNADHKAEWYTNLFEAMGNGAASTYAIVNDGTASNADWITFALEAGLVTMSQANDDGEWESVIYSNVGDITEDYDDTALAIAEAEYTKEMAKIETKDLQYDMELESIDTEHTSLETEYESIQTAISSNIERTLQIYT
ncbi:MAG: hypothetical protein R3Y28_05930 [Candidatus Gastranaerophilales bacterium]